MSVFGKWGGDEWGETSWGGLRGGGSAPVITPLEPADGAVGVPQLRPISIRLTDDVQVAPSTLSVVVAGLIWVMGGVAVNGSTIEWTANAGHGFDVVLTPPAPYPIGSLQEVLVVVSDSDGNMSSELYSFLVGTGLRMLAVRNPFENMLMAYFNRPMKLDESFFMPAHWLITPISAGAKPLKVTEVTARDGRPDVAHLRYEGGGSTYLLTAINLVDEHGNGFERGYDSKQFEILFGDQEDPTVRLFNSIWGPLGISQRARTRRTIDDHVANRSLALALDEQFRIRMQRLDATAGRDGRPGKRRT
jgi:hypothetical protein